MLVFYVCAIGFVSAALFGTVLVILAQVADLRFPQKTLSQWVVALPLIAFIGPYWVAREAVLGYNVNNFPWFIAVLGALISVIWSFCAGVFVVQFLNLINIV